MSALLTVRRARRGDLEQLVQLCRAHARFERSDLARGLAGRLDTALFGVCPQALAWVAVDNNELLGYASASAAFSTWQGAQYLHLDCLYLVGRGRGRGTGSKLMSAVMRHARLGGYRWMEWQTPVWNSGAQRFYRRFGATGRTKVRFELRLAAGGRSP